MFLGTSAKVYFFPCACAPALNANRAAIPTLKARLLIGVPSCLLGSTLLCRALAADPLEQNRQYNEQADKGALPIGIDTRHEKRVPDDFDQSRPDEGAV